MKKDTRNTKELKGTPQTTKGVPNYSIIKRVNTDGDNWEVTFEKWVGCSCTKKTTTINIQVDGGRFPQNKHLIKAGY
jgi:hypothetical protein